MSRARWAGAVLLAACAFAAAYWLLGRPDAALVKDEHFQRIKTSGILRVGMDASFPPFEQLEGGEVAGLDADLARALGERMGLRAAFVLTGFDALYEQLTAGHFDVVISAVPYDRLRTRDVAYSYIYFRGGEVLVASAGGGPLTLSALNGRRLGVELGSGADTLARSLQRRTGYALESFVSLEAAADALESGRLDAVLADAVSARLLGRARPTLVVGRDPIGSEPNYVIALPPDAPQLLAAINRHLRTMETDGTLNALIAKWL